MNNSDTTEGLTTTPSPRLPLAEELGITEALRNGRYSHGFMHATDFLRLAFVHGYNADDYFDIIGDSFITVSYEDAEELARFDDAMEACATHGIDPDVLGLTPPTARGLTHTRNIDGEIILLEGLAHVYALAHTCSGEVANEEDFSELIHEQQLTNPEPHDPDRVRYLVTTEDVCETPGCTTFTCYRFEVEHASPLF